ncbi:MAG: PAS domain S-box protein [Nitrospirae bacterium]|nr:PAS domain S-box protein [Nitrospirota bacterium]
MFKDSQDIYKSIFTHSQSVMWVYDPQTLGIVEVNDSACCFYGYTREEFCQKNLTDIIVNTEGQIRENIRDILDGKLRYLTHRHRISTGEVRDVEVYTGSFMIDNNDYVCCTIHDITDKLRVEQQNKTILRTCFDGFLMVNIEGRPIFVNESYCNMTGYSREELLQMTISDLEVIESPQETQRHIRRIIETGKDIFATRHKRKDGSIIDVESSANFIKSDNVIFSFIRDITERKRMEEEIMTMNLNLKERIKEEVGKNRLIDQVMYEQSRHIAMGELLMNISHHWRQPLCAIGLILQDIKDAFLHDELSYKYLDNDVAIAMSELKALSDTVDNFRDFYNSDRERRQFNIAGEINRAVALLSGYMRNRGIVIYKTLDETLTIHGLPNEFARAILNILTNAKDILERRNIVDGVINITLQKDDSIGKIIISAMDNGGGISDDIIDKVFDPYFTTKDKTRGTGIGLYMSKVIIERYHNGHILARNINNGWCEFRIEI